MTQWNAIRRFFFCKATAKSYASNIMSLPCRPFMDRDLAVAQARGQAGWTDYSGLSRTLSRLSWEEARQIAGVLEQISQPYIDGELKLLHSQGRRLCYDGGPDRHPNPPHQPGLPQRCSRTHGQRKRAIFGFSVSVPIGLVGGLIGLGGAEFRLPVLAGPLGYTAHRAVPLNLAISLITLSVALAARSQSLPVSQLAPLIPVMLSLIASAMLAAFYGAGWAARISNDVLKRIILILLLAIGVVLILEAFLPGEAAGFIPQAISWRVLSGALFGIAIGLFSSVLGVAGGELIIPTLVYAFGVDIKLAGTASLLISLPTVLVGLVRFARLGGYSQRRDLYETVAPMGMGSVLGAIAGGLLVGFIPARMLKVLLGLILCYSAWRIFE